MKVKDLYKVLAKVDPELEVWINEKDETYDYGAHNAFYEIKEVME